MAVDNNKVVQWFRNQVGKITYSMYGSRNGTDGTGDCSGCVVQAIRDSGGKPYAYLYNTDSMHQYLLDNGYKLVAENTEWNAKAGDVYIFGKRGQSGGAAGHTGVISTNDPNAKEISCDYSTGGAVGSAIQEYVFDQYYGWDGEPYFYVYRNENSTPTTPQKPTESSWVKEEGIYTPYSNVVLRKGASTSDSAISTIKGGNKIKYDAYKVDANGYVWIRQPRGNNYGYIATGNSKNCKRSTWWGTFK
ncbi:hypothetical protein BG262_02930 [Floricoccus penangensis]|uniref:SH3b domain-containing protein n=1 Tax=Floricoccus penangensis TaxID=1859475 RepID=A0A9Q5JG66_9LACT|nr:peptidoglycan amidohydrolase family protein [Floricoccus penangensis]OFI46769.1 hypothetical protein BG262_02930 [Floricoccus penangensis]